MREQACKYGAKIETEFVTKLERDEQTGLFTATWGSGCATARTVLLATGVTNRRPPMDEELHDDALARGLIRYCPICDGYEVTDKKVGVIGSDSHGVAEALFLRSYTADVTLIAPDKALRLKPEDQQKLKDAGIECVDGPAQAVAIADGLHRRRHRRGPLHLRQHLSGARLGHPHPARRDGRRRARRATAASGRQPPAHQRRRPLRRGRRGASASTRSAMRWAKAASRRPPSATISARSSRAGASRSREMEEAESGS